MGDNGNNDHNNNSNNNNNNNNDDNNDNTKIKNNNNISNSNNNNNNKVIRSSHYFNPFDKGGYFKNMLVRCRPGRDAYVISSHNTVTTGERNDNMDSLDNTVVTMNENEKDEEKRELILRTV